MIVLRAKGIEFQITHITADDKPDWFLEISPHGKVPVLWVGDAVLFESNAIAEYLDETVAPRLHPEDPVKRARNRAWTDFVPDFAKAIGGVNYAKSKEAQEEAMASAQNSLARLEEALRTERALRWLKSCAIQGAWKIFHIWITGGRLLSGMKLSKALWCRTLVMYLKETYANDLLTLPPFWKRLDVADILSFKGRTNLDSASFVLVKSQYN